MPPVCVDDMVLRDLAQPEVERHRRVAEILRQPLAGLEQHVLHDVAGIDATRHRLVEPQADHPPQGRPVRSQSSSAAAASACATRCNRFCVSLASGHMTRI